MNAQARPEGGGSSALKIVLIILAIVGLCCATGVGGFAYMTYYAVQKAGEFMEATMKPIMEINSLTERAARDNPWSSPAEDAIAFERLDVYLAVREQAMGDFRENRDTIKKYEAQNQGGGGNANIGFGEMMEIIKVALSMPKGWAQALVDQGMSPEEFCYITDQVYGSWYKTRDDVPEHADAYKSTYMRQEFFGEAPEASVDLFEQHQDRIDAVAEPEFDSFIRGFANGTARPGRPR